MKRNKVTEEDKRRNKQRTQIKTSADNTTERPPERPPNDPPNDPWIMSCQTQDPGPSLTATWSAELRAPPHPCFIPNHQIKKMNVPPIQQRYVRGMTKGTFPPCKLNMLEQPQQIMYTYIYIYNIYIYGHPSTWIWPTKASKTTQQITANLIGTATIATNPPEELRPMVWTQKQRIATTLTLDCIVLDISLVFMVPNFYIYIYIQFCLQCVPGSKWCFEGYSWCLDGVVYSWRLVGYVWMGAWHMCIYAYIYIIKYIIILYILVVFKRVLYSALGPIDRWENQT